MEANEQPKLGIDTPKIFNFMDWYSEVITKAEMIEYYDVSGCYVLRPWSYAIWEKIQESFDREIKKLGVKNCYFPMFVSQAALEREETHIADFAPEAAWITRSGNSEMIEPIAIRPTDETVMYPSFAKWVQSHRDLPIKLNQWCNVVRWELKHPIPFLRTREFLWQEGHTAFQNRAEAEEEVFKILDLYTQIYKDLLAIPVVKGRKSDKKFAGDDFTTTIEAYVAANGHMISGATSHHLGQNFSRMFEITFEDPKNPGQKVYAHQNSWRLSTRAIGAMIMIHGDNKGIVLPPRVAAVQMIVIPVGIFPIQNHKQLVDKTKEIVQILVNAGIRAESDLRDNLTPHWKLKYWQVKGVPVRVEVGIKDLAQNKVLLVQRFSGQKRAILIPNIIEESKELLEEIHTAMYDKQVRVLYDHIKTCVDWLEFVETMNKTNLLLSPFCGQSDCEEQIKAKSDREEPEKALGIKIVCIPFEQPWQTELPNDCINPDCTKLALFFALFGRSY